MGHAAFEWVKRRKVDFGTTVGETIVIGDPVDVGDWEEMIVQLDTLAVGGSPSAGNITANVQTTVSTEQTGWESCLSADVNVSVTVDGYTILTINPNSASLANGLRKFARLVLVHAVTTGSQSATVHATCLLKKRTP